MRSRLRGLAGLLGWPGLVFAVFLAAALLLDETAPGTRIDVLASAAAYVSGLLLALRLLRAAIRRGIWRLRNRLFAAYLAMAVVPVLLIATLAYLATRAVSSQLAVYLVTNELNRRMEELQMLGRHLAAAPPAQRAIDAVYQERFPGVAVLLREGGREARYPAGARIPAPAPGWKTLHGVVSRDGQFYLWSHENTAAGDITVAMPLNAEFLGALVPSIGQVGFGTLSAGGGQPLSIAPAGAVPGSRLPEFLDALDPELRWFAAMPAMEWNHPGEQFTPLIVAVRSRATALAAALYDPDADLTQGVLLILLALVAALFVVVELVALVIGVRLTRTMTGAVHRLYLGTQRAAGGDFAHRIEVKGRDQLADLSHSFNRMTESIERLLVVSKEKERLQSEVEIASEVQNRLYPHRPLETRSLRVTGMCHAARVVSGDYFDYAALGDGKVLLAIGDVAGKGISAALLMASLQSSLRTQLAGSGVTMSRLVARVNQQLHASTAPEKFATFCAGTFDESSGAFTYTNAGHVPPLLVRRGTGQRLDVNGMVVGAFAGATYSESCVELASGDLLVFFTDGVSEPENAYGEMFGEDRVAEVIARHAHLSEDRIMESVWKSVREWSGEGEQPDDMTLLLARRL